MHEHRLVANRRRKEVVSATVGELTAKERRLVQPRLLKIKAWEMVGLPKFAHCHLLEQSPIRFPSTRIVTNMPLPDVGVALRNTEKAVLETVPSTRVIA